MCHSVEMYLPEMTRRAAEGRLAGADFAAAGRGRRAVDAGLDLGLALLARLWRRLGRTPVDGLTRERMDHG